MGKYPAILHNSAPIMHTLVGDVSHVTDYCLCSEPLHLLLECSYARCGAECGECCSDDGILL